VKVNIGMIQMESKVGRVEENMAKARKLTKDAVLEKADIICFPELFSTGYNLGMLGKEIIKLGMEYYDYTINIISECAAENSVHIIAPIPRLSEMRDVLYNSAVVFDHHGQVLGSYNKMHMFALEKFYFKDGWDYQIFNTPFGKIGIAICLDLGFPEVCRSLCLDGADVIFAPSAWMIEDEDIWDLNVPQRALENNLFLVGVNAVGNEGGLHLFGKSKICNPRGKIIKELPKDKEIVSVTTIDFDELMEHRTYLPYLRDRKPPAYKRVCLP